MSSKKRKRAATRPVSEAERTGAGSYWPWIALGIVLLVTAAIRIRLLHVPLERDEGEFAYMGQLMLHGIAPYKLAYNMKFPGIYAAYALMMAIFGQTIVGVHVGLLAVNLASIVLIFMLGKRMFDPMAGALAAAALAVMSLLPGVYGSSAHATQYALPLVLGGCLLLLKGAESDRRGTLVGSGLLFGTAVLMKQHAAFFVPLAVIYNLWVRVAARQANPARTTSNALIMIIGAGIPFALTCLILKSVGVFDKFWFWTFTYAHQYVSELPFSIGMENLQEHLLKAIGPGLLIWMSAAVGLTALWWSSRVRRHGVFLVGFLVSGFLTACPGFFFRGHYFVLMLPAVALLAAAGVTAIRDAIPRTSGVVRAVPVAAFVVALIIPLFAGQWFTEQEFTNERLFFEAKPDEVSRMMYGTNPFPESVAIGEYIRKHSSPADQIAVIGSEPQIYFYAQRRSATGFIYTYGLMEVQKYASQMQRDMIREIETARPRYLVFCNIPTSWLTQPKSDRTILDWMREYAPAGYNLVGLTEISQSEDYSATYWGRDAGTHAPASPFLLYVFERKPGG